MSQHYLKYHFKSFICTINNKAFDEVNGNNGNDSETDAMNGNSNGRKVNSNGNVNASNNNNNNNMFIRITENPLTDSIVN